VCVRSRVCVCMESLSSLPYHIVGVFRRSAVACGRWVYVFRRSAVACGRWVYVFRRSNVSCCRWVYVFRWSPLHVVGGCT